MSGEGFQNPFRRLAPSSADSPSALSVSDYQEKRFNADAAFDAYKRPTKVRTPRGDYVADAPTTLSASQYLRQKYGDFSNAVDVTPPPQPAPPQTHIMGTDALTVGDLKLLQNTIDMEIIRLANIRSDAASLTIRKNQLEFMAENLANVLGAVERGEVKIEEVAIFPANARLFLKTFRTSENLPELFDSDGRSPASLAPAAAPPASATSPASSNFAAGYAGAPASQRDLLPWFFQTIQHLKWNLEADYLVEQAKQREMRKDLKEMEERIVGYSYTDTPMPQGYDKLFLERIRRIQKELNNIPE